MRTGQGVKRPEVPRSPGLVTSTARCPMALGVEQNVEHTQPFHVDLAQGTTRERKPMSSIRDQQFLAFSALTARGFPSQPRRPMPATRQTARSRSAKPVATARSPREAPFTYQRQFKVAPVESDSVRVRCKRDRQSEITEQAGKSRRWA
jgi:hypothetical protein